MSKKKVLVLVDCQIEGVDYRCGQLLAVESSVAKSYSNVLDSNEQAVSVFAIQGVEIVEHKGAAASLDSDDSGSGASGQ